MKTSTILVLTYFGLLLGGILALFIASKNLPETYPETITPNNIAITPNNIGYVRELPSYSVVVLQENAKCRLIFSDSCYVEWDVPMDSVKNGVPAFVRNGVPAFVRNDTLYVTNTPTNHSWNYRIMAKHVKSVFVQKGACVRLYNPAQDEISVFLDNGECFLDTTNNQPKADRMWKKLHLKLQAKGGSYLEVNSWISELSAQLDSSRMMVNSTTYVKHATLSLENKSDALFYTAPNALTFKRDTESTIRLQ